MTRVLCYRCSGSKKYLGCGMTELDCYLCDDDGRVETNPDETINIKKPEYNKRSKVYKEAINDLQEIHPDLSRKDIQKLFDDRYNEI